jgi:peptidoglycan/LPS O-acetylase OafA/YrhL
MMGYALSAAELGAEPGPAVLRTGDQALRSADGLFYITGRMSRFIKVFGNRIGLDEVETICGAAGFSTIATGVDGKLLVVTRDEGRERDISGLLSRVLKLPLHTIELRYMSEFPVLPTGKIDYAGLKASVQPADQVPAAETKRVSDIYREIFGPRGDNESCSFAELGGDSLTYVHASLALENIIGTLPEDWHTLPARELQALATEAPQAARAAGTPDRRFILEKSDTLRALACLLVVALHVFGAEPKDGLHFTASSPWRLPFELFGLLRMPLFAALAGFLYAAMPATTQSFSDFLRHRALSLALPGFVVSMIYLGLHIAMGKQEASLSYAVLNGYEHLWFLYALFALVVFVGAIDALFHPKTRDWFLLLAAFYLVAPLFPWDGVLSIKGSLQLSPFFILGLALYRDPSILSKNSGLIVMAVIATAGLVAHALAFWGVLSRGNIWEPWLEPIASAALILLAARFVPRVTKFEWVGLYSYAIYLWHPFCNAALRTVLTHVGLTAPAVLFVSGTIAGVLVPIAMYKVIERWLRPLSLALIGRETALGPGFSLAVQDVAHSLVPDGQLDVHHNVGMRT